MHSYQGQLGEDGVQLRHIFAAKRDDCLGHFGLLRVPGGNLRMAMLLSRIAEFMPLPAELGRVDSPVVVALQNISQIRATCEKIGNGMEVLKGLFWETNMVHDPRPSLHVHCSNSLLAQLDR